MAATGANRPRIAIVGATGTVGGQIAELLGEHDLDYADLRLFSAEGSADAIQVGKRALPVEALVADEALADRDLVFLAVPSAVADRIAATAKRPLLIDSSWAMRAPAAVPLAAPGLVSGSRLREMSAAARRIGGPHPAAQVIASVLRALEGAATFGGATIMLGAASFGNQMISRLFTQSTDVMNARLALEDDEPQIAFNVLLPPVDLEGAIGAQIEVLLGARSPLALQAVQVPAFHGAGVAMLAPPNSQAAEWAERLRVAPGMIVVEGSEASTLVDGARQEATVVRITQRDTGATLWAVFDPSRLAAMTAVWIAETLIAA